MSPTRSRAIVLSLLCLWLIADRSAAAPEAGATLPSLTARDVLGQSHRLEDLIRGPTLLVAITDRNAGDAMQAWFDAANTRAPQANRVSIISVETPFFIGDEYGRSKARERVPGPFRHASLFDKNHAMARALDLHDDHLPYAFAVSGDDHVLAVVHGMPGDPGAKRLWAALERSKSHPASR